MKLFNIAAGAMALALVAGSAHAQIFLNEIYASHSGTDDQEFIELVGTPGASLNNYMVLIVEGEQLQNGILDRAWDLTGLTIPSTGHFVLGDTLVSPNNFVIGTQDRIENGAETFYLVDAGSAGGVTAINALVGTDVSTPPASLSTVTVIPSMSTVKDIIAMYGNDPTDLTYDGAAVLGPDLAGPFFPAGVFRDQDHPNPWCTANWLDFVPGVNLNRPRTPGALNSSCAGAPPISTSFCDAADGAHAFCPCSASAPAPAPDSGCQIAQGTGGVKADVSSLQSTLATIVGTGFPPASTPTALLIRGNNQEATPVLFGDGVRCVGLTGFLRLAATVASGGSSTHLINHGAGPGTFYYQIWFRNTPQSFCDSAAAYNLSNGRAITY